MTPEEKLILDSNKALADAVKALTRQMQSTETNISNRTRAGVGTEASGAPTASKKMARFQDDLEKTYRESIKSLSGWNKSQDDLRKMNEKLLSLTYQQRKVDQEGIDLENEYNQALLESTNALDSRRYEYDKLLGRTFGEQQSMLAHSIRGTKSLQSELSKQQRNASLLTASLLTSHIDFNKDTQSHAIFVNNLSKLTEKGFSGIGKSFLRNSNMLDEITGTLKENLSPSDFADFTLKLGAAGETISESIQALKTQFGDIDLSKIVAKSISLNASVSAAGGEDNFIVKSPGNKKQVEDMEKIRATMVDVANKLKAQGHDLGFNGKKSEEMSTSRLAKAIRLVESRTKTTTDSFSKLGQKVNNLNPSLGSFAKWAQQMISLKPNGTVDRDGTNENVRIAVKEKIQAGKDKFGAYVAAAATVAGFTKSMNKANIAFSEMSKFNIANIPKSYFGVATQAVQMGLTFEQTAEFIRANQQTMGMQGNALFDKSSSAMADSMKAFGYTSAQSAELVGPLISSAIDSGIDTKNTQKLNSYTQDTMTAFSKLAAITGITATEFLKLEKELNESTPVREKLLALDGASQLEYVNELRVRRKALVTLGMSDRAANDFIKTQESFKTQKVSDRFDEAANMKMQMQRANMSEEDINAAYRYKINPNAATPEEAAAMPGIMARFAKEQAQLNQSSSLSQQVFMQETPLGLTQTAIDQAAVIAQNKKAKNIGSEAQNAEQEKLAKGSELGASLGNIKNSASALLGLAFPTAIVSAIGSLVAFTYQLSMAAGALGGKGVLGGITNAVAGKGGIVGKIATALGGTATVAAGSGILGANGLPMSTTVPTAGSPAGAGGAKGSSVWSSVKNGAGKASKFLGGNKLLAGLTVLEGISALSSATDIEDQRKSGAISNKEANIQGGKLVGGLAGAGTAGLIGAGIGQVLIPIPVVGAVIGGAIGGAIGGWLGKEGGGAIANAISSDEPKINKAFAESANTISALSATAAAANTPMVNLQQQTASNIAPTFQPSIIEPANIVAAQNVNNKVNDTQADKQGTSTSTESVANDKIVNVSDLSAKEQLVAIATSLSQTVDLLTKISEDGLKTNSNHSLLTPRSMPTSLGFITGISNV
jgi:hypothetical protein